MKGAVRAAFVAFSEPFEGIVDFLYLDLKGFVTTAMGILVDPIEYCLALPFVRSDGTYASRVEVADAWHTVKARKDLAPHGGMAFRGVTTIRLPKEGVARVVQQKLDANDVYLRSRFGPGYDDWPADAQLAVHSMSWACGPAFRYPRLETACRAEAFDVAMGECTINPQIGTIVKRNEANRLLFSNAERVMHLGLDRDVLYWPRDLTVTEAVTDPDLSALADDED